MKVLVFGSEGQLGSNLVKSFDRYGKCIGISRDQADIVDAQAINDALAEYRPEVVINAAAYTDVEGAESNSEEAFSINAVGPKNIAIACKQHGARLLHFSTDFVFDGRQSTAYKPEDIASPVNVYGASKLSGEKQVLSVLPLTATIIRTSWLYSPWGDNFVTKILSLLRTKPELNVVADQIGTPTSVATIARVLNACSRETWPTGIYHLSDAGVSSWYDFAVCIARYSVDLGLLPAEPIPIRPVPSSAFVTEAARPNFSLLDSSACYADFGATAEHWSVPLRRCLERISNDQ